MLIELAVSVAFAQDPCAGAAPEDQCEQRYAHRAMPLGTIVVPAPPGPPPIPSAALRPRAVPDCALGATDLAEVREEIQGLRRRQGAAIGVAAEGPGCRDALDEVLRTGPFLGVYRADLETETDRSCVAVLRAAPDGWAIDPYGACDGDQPQAEAPPAVAETQVIAAPGASRVTTLAVWLPYGGTLRVNQDLGSGIAAQVDLGWHPPKLWDVSYDDKFLGPDSKDTSSLRWMFGLEAGNGGLAGGYVGARVGFEAATPATGFEPNEGILMAMLGHRWIGPQRGVFEVAAGFQGAIPIGPHADKTVIITPAVDVRIGGASRK